MLLKAKFIPVCVLLIASLWISKGYAQITLSEKNAALQKVLKKIEAQSGYTFFYTYELVENAGTVTVTLNKATLEQALDSCLRSKSLIYEIIQKTVVIKKKEAKTSSDPRSDARLFGDLHGMVMDSTGRGLAGASVLVTGSAKITTTDAGGRFLLKNIDPGATLRISYVGYKTAETGVQGRTDLTVILHQLLTSLSNVEVTYSSGYQDIPQERATGSFVQLDNTLLNRRVSTDILSRIEDVSSGVIFDRNVPQRRTISIRGQNTIFGNAQPLIVIDNFPYDGDINSINPNDVESITILKDAAAASIWGARAGNGVIVIVTKRGKYGSAPQVSFNANRTIGDRPDVFYRSRISSSDFIDIEKMLFAQGYFSNREQSVYNDPLTPVVELLIAGRDGSVSAAQANSQIDALRNVDDRNDFKKYFYRHSDNRQYSVNVSGGSDNQRYYLSAGYDDNNNNLVGNTYRRFTVNATNTWLFLDKKLEFTAGLFFSSGNTQTDNPGPGSITLDPAGYVLYPYAQLTDGHGHSQAITHDYRNSFIESKEQQGFLNWSYDPIAEISLADNTDRLTDYRLSPGLKYKILPGLRAEVSYQYERSLEEGRNDQSAATYYTRNLINMFTQVNQDGSLTRPVPPGGILDLSTLSSVTQNVRTQLAFNRSMHGKHVISAIGGWEIRNMHTTGNTGRLYGYDPDHATSQPVAYNTVFPQSISPYSSDVIPNKDGLTDQTDRSVSYYANASYTFDRKYTISGSGRLDQSNLFGVHTNQKGVPLWSAGLAWNLHEAGFYHVSWLPLLRLRTTYGYNGNIYKSLSAYTTAYYNDPYYSPIQQPYSTILNPPNPDLRWERINIVNAGIDFETRHKALSGSLEYFQKHGLDLIGSTPFRSSSGVSTFMGNNSATLGHGIDLTLNTHNIDRAVRWTTNFLFSYITDKVTRYMQPDGASNYVTFAYGFIPEPLQGKPLNAIYSYRWAGLDPQTGAPLSYLKGAVSEDYRNIVNNTQPADLVYNGPARPVVFGSVRNTVSWKAFSLSANISYRLGYYVRRESIKYGAGGVLGGQGGQGDYYKRWQHPGDELHTQVPSMPAAIDYNRDNVYLYSSALVDKGDHIRWQDLDLSYTLSRAQLGKLPFSNARMYVYMNNIGIIWKAAKGPLDPDYETGLTGAVPPPPRTVAAGVKLDF